MKKTILSIALLLSVFLVTANTGISEKNPTKTSKFSKKTREQRREFR